ncbi:hypothetical protein ENUP19_0083G0134 [Entamoeba nuttalli]|uniref:Rho GTPase activating protein, putative n=2 Tax=Entamoeba nuttalli TaxID=412467 RepID=K2H8B5_ENTNP|nr:Rho GTPase activating protein, putative [Entamoeba nuttalli P19]EKE38759.1 Rho GTPase activating protein, putative [Entamoeba nuttalli P19]|eukprot:XP_008858906.1 Rho GTPase activating protein, putative [Entamoeba nuttalli P19]
MSEPIVFKSISILTNKKFKEVSIEEPITTPFGSILMINEKKVIELPRTIMTFNINMSLIPKEMNITKEQLSLAFEIIYDKEYLFFCKTKEEFRHWAKIIGLGCKTYGVFCFPLEAVVKKSRWRVPNIIYRCIGFLKSHDAINVEGIFRMNARVGRIEEMKKMADNDEDIHFDEKDTCYLATSLLKAYLRSMVEPLIPYEYFEYYIQLPEGNVDSKKFINSLTESHQDTLWYIGEFLMEVVKNKEVNKMDETNLATCFGLVFCDNPPSLGLTELEFTKKAIQSFEFLLRNFKYAFSDVKKRNIAQGIEPPQYPAFQPLVHLPFDILIEQIKMELRDIKKSRRMSATYLTDKSARRKKVGGSLSIASTTSAVRKEYLKTKYKKSNGSFADLSLSSNLETTDHPKSSRFSISGSKSKTIQISSLSKQSPSNMNQQKPSSLNAPVEHSSSISSHHLPKPPSTDNVIPEPPLLHDSLKNTELSH